MNWQGLELSILGPAFIAGILVLSTHVPLGRLVLKRGIIFIDLAVAQIAGLGVILANVLGFDSSPWQVQLAAVTTAMAGALILHRFEKYYPQIQEALIGVVFVLAATMSMLLLANNPHGGEQLKELLVGQILWVSYEQLFIPAMLYAGILVCWFALNISQRMPLAFYLIFAIAVTVSVQLVGVFLVFASLIIPALATRHLARNKQLWLAYVIGATGYAAGLIASAILDLPSGAVIVWALAIVAVLYSQLNQTNR